MKETQTRLGRTWWMSVIGVAATGAVAAASAAGWLAAGTAAALTAGIAAICGTHSVSRAIEDGERHKAEAARFTNGAKYPEGPQE